jgi:N utilization substance protein B
MKDLFNKTIDSDEEFVSLIASKTQNWEADRIALVDMLLMKMALSEILYSPYIPVKVSINEYLELAKLYSTPNSHTFINGVLDKIHHELKSSGKIQKQGRGLVE